MQIIKGHFPESKDFTPDSSWTKLEEPEARWANFKAIPMSLVLSILTIGFGYPFFQITISWTELVVGMILALLIIVPLHQFMHSTSFLEDPRSERVLYGYDFKSRIVYAYYDGKMPRKNYITSLIAPFIILSILPTMVMYTFHRYMNIVMVMMIVNALFCGIDIMTAYRVIKFTPKKCIIRKKGYDTYYKEGAMKELK